VDDRELDRLQDLMRGLWPLYDTRGWYRGLTDLADDALAVLAELPSSPEHTILALTLRSDQARALTAMLGYTSEVEAAYERLLESLQGVDVPQVYPVLRALASFYMFRSEHAKSTEIGRQILHLGESQDDAMIRADGHLFVGTGLAFLGRLEDGLPDLESGIRPFEQGPSRARSSGLRNDPRVAILTALSLLHRWQGRLDRSAQRSEQAVALALQLGHASTTGYALFHAGLLSLWRGQPETSRAFAVRAIDVADEHELPIWRAVGTVLLGASAIALGIGDEGMRWMAEGLERYQGLRTPPVFWPFLLQLRAGACARVGQHEEGLGIIHEALELEPYNADHHLLHGDLLLASGSTGDAEVAYGRALEVAQRWGALTPALRAAVRLCRMSRSSDPSIRSRRSRSLREILESFTEGLETPDLLEARQLLAADV
jgi:tetratricopeptide (TPR) repeat protein